VKSLQLLIDLLVIVLYLIADFSSKGIFVIYQDKSLLFKVLLATKIFIVVVLKISFFYSLIIFIIGIEILDFYKNLYFLILIDSRVTLEDITELRELIPLFLNTERSLKLIDLKTLYFLILLSFDSSVICRQAI
jgi:hypothetical protein